MPKTDDFADYVVELLAPLGSVTARRMFGGHGIYSDGLMFALIANQVLYFKCDESTQGRFEAAGSQPFVYASRIRRVTLGYWSAPGDAMESTALAMPWARLALDAALRKATHATTAPSHRRRASSATPSSSRRTRSGRLTNRK